MSRLHKPLKRSKIQQTRRGPILWTPLSLGPPKTRKTTDLQVKTLCNKLDVMYQIYSYILL